MNKKHLTVAWISLFLTGCVSTTVSGTFGGGKPDVYATVDVPIELTKKEFPTSFGTLKKGMNQDEVRNILGEPYFSTKPYNNSQVWWYQFSENRRIIAYFTDGKVTEVVEKVGMTSGEM